MLQFNCPYCLAVFQIEPQAAGGQAMCPSCSGVVAIPADAGAGPPVVGPGGDVGVMPAAAGAAVSFGCPQCANVFQVEPSMAGQHVACPYCHAIALIPGEVGGAPPVGWPPAPPGVGRVEEPPPMPNWSAAPSMPPVEQSVKMTPAVDFVRNPLPPVAPVDVKVKRAKTETASPPQVTAPRTVSGPPLPDRVEKPVESPHEPELTTIRIGEPGTAPVDAPAESLASRLTPGERAKRRRRRTLILFLIGLALLLAAAWLLPRMGHVFEV